MQFLVITFLAWRLGLFLIAWIGGKILPFIPRFPYSDIFLIPSELPKWVWSFANFDGVHYLTITKQGYSAQFTQVFFPLYPILIGFMHKILHFISPIILGLFLSNTFFFLSLFMLSKLLKLDYKKDTIRWILVFLIVFPTSFYFASLYTESLFFFLVISSFYAARKKWWLLSGILGALASFTRLFGILLLPALVWEWHQQLKIKNENFKILHSPLTLIPVGLISYMLYLQLKFGDWLYFWHVQPVFGAERSGRGLILLPQVIWRYLKILTSIPLDSGSFWIPALELVSTIGALAAIIVGYLRKVRTSYLIFSFLSVILPTLTGTFSSMPRYILMVFPMFIILGMLKSRLAKCIIIFVSTLLLITLTILFTAGHWVA